MPRLMLNGRLPSKEELLTDDLVIQMIEEAKTEAVKEIPTKEGIIQALTVEDLKEHEVIKQIQKDAPTKESILQELKTEDVPDAIKQKIIEDSKVVPPAIESVLKQIAQVASDTKGSVTDKDKKKPSVFMTEYLTLSSR